MSRKDTAVSPPEAERMNAEQAIIVARVLTDIESLVASVAKLITVSQNHSDFTSGMGGLRAGGFGRLCCCGPAHTAFSLVPGTYPSYSLPRLTLDDLHYVLRKKLKNLAITILLSLVI